MSKSFRTISILSSFLIVFCLILSLPVQAAKFLPENDNSQTTDVNDTYENLYVANRTVHVTKPTRKDLVAAGSDIKIEAPVERDLILAGNNVEVNTYIIGATTRIAGNHVTLHGTFNEDVIIAGKDVEIKDSIIHGDLIVAAQSLKVSNTQIDKDFRGSYQTLDGDLNQQVRGKIYKDTFDNNKHDQDSGFKIFLKFGQELSLLLGLLVLAYYLSKCKKLEVSGILLNRRLGFDLLIGLGFLVLALPILILSFILQIYPLVIALLGLGTLLLFLSNIYLPIYLANLVRNAFKLKFSLIYTIIGTYLILFILSIIPGVNIVTNFILFFILMANFGFILRKLTGTIDKAMKS